MDVYNADEEPYSSIAEQTEDDDPTSDFFIADVWSAKARAERAGLTNGEIAAALRSVADEIDDGTSIVISDAEIMVDPDDRGAVGDSEAYSGDDASR